MVPDWEERREPLRRLRPAPARQAWPRGGARSGRGGAQEPAAARDGRPGSVGRGEAGRGRRDGKGRPRGPRAAPRQPGCSRRAPSAAMGLETEKADVQLFMDDDSYSRHSGVDYADPEKFADAGSDRDPHRLNSHLKVKLGAGPSHGQGVPVAFSHPGPEPSLRHWVTPRGPGSGIHPPRSHRRSQGFLAKP